jgi:hypothetical protein
LAAITVDDSAFRHGREPDNEGHDVLACGSPTGTKRLAMRCSDSEPLALLQGAQTMA